MWPFNRREKRASAENPSVPIYQDSRILGLVASSAAGVNVTEEKALGVPAVWAAVQFLAGTLASLPLGLYRRTSDGREPLEGDLNALLHDAPNDEWTSYGWRNYCMIRTLLGGRSYTFIRRKGNMQVDSLWPLEPDKVKVERYAGKKRYRYEEFDAPIAARDMIDIPFMLGADQLEHVNPLHRLKNAVGLAIALEQYASRYFQNGGVPPLSLEGPITSPGAAKRASADIEESIKTAQQEGRNVLVMPTGHVLKQVGFHPEQSQMEEARRFQLEEIARIYDLPPVFLQDLTHGTFSNTEQQDLHFVKHTLTQWLRRWEQEMNLKLFGRGQRTRFVEFNIDGLLRGDFKTRMDGYAQAVQNGIKTPNEVRRKENDPPKDGGDDLMIQQNMTGLGRLDSAANQENGDDD